MRGPRSASRFRIHHDPGSACQPHEAEWSARPRCRRLRRNDHRRARTGAKGTNPGSADRFKAWLPKEATPTVPFLAGSASRIDQMAHRRGDPPAFNAHSRCDRGSGLVQHVFRLPARPPPVCVHPAIVRRAANRKTLYVIIRDILRLTQAMIRCID